MGTDENVAVSSFSVRSQVSRISAFLHHVRMRRVQTAANLDTCDGESSGKMRKSVSFSKLEDVMCHEYERDADARTKFYSKADLGSFAQREITRRQLCGIDSMNHQEESVARVKL